MRKSKVFASLLVVVMIFLSITSVAGATSERTTIFFNDKRIVFDVDPVTEKGTMLVEVTKTLKAMGVSYSVNQKTKTTTIINPKNNQKSTFTLGSKTAMLNGKKTALTLAPKIINGYTLAPLSFITKASGQTFVLDKDSNRVYIGYFNSTTKDPFLEIEWGRNINDVKKSENLSLLGSDGNSLLYRVFLGNEELPAQLLYIFSSGKLDSIFYSTNGDEEPGNQYTLFNQLVSILDKIYKPLSSDIYLWADKFSEELYDDLYGRDYDTKIGTALLHKDLRLIKSYQYRNTSVSVILKNKGTVQNPDFVVTILYNHIKK